MVVLVRFHFITYLVLYKIQCLITFLAMSMSKFHHMTGCVFKWCASQKQWIRIKKQKKVCMPSRKKKKWFNQGALRHRCTFGTFCVQQTNNSAIKIILDKACLWTITCCLALGLLKQRMIKANPKESGIHHLTLIDNR